MSAAGTERLSRLDCCAVSDALDKLKLGGVVSGLPQAVVRSGRGDRQLAHAVALGKPCINDVHVDANIRPPGTGAWALPPIPHMEPVFGKKHVR